MVINNVSSARTSVHTRAIGRAVHLAWQDIAKVHGRMTEELRAEDAIRGLRLAGTEVHVLVDEKYEFKKDGLRDLVKGLLKKHGVEGVRVELHAGPQRAVHEAWASIEQVQRRLTRDLRVEDGVAGLSLMHDGRVSVALKANQPYDEARIADAVKSHLAAAGLKNATLEMVRPAIQPVPLHVVVDSAMDAIRQVQGRLTADMRAEDDILNLRHSDDGVRVVLRAHAYFNEADIAAAVKQHLHAAGYPGDANLTFIRPAIQPVPPMVVTPPPANALSPLAVRCGVSNA